MIATFSEMYVLLNLALELTDLLLEQLVITRGELESSQYGPFPYNLSVDNQNREDTRYNNSTDNSSETENNLANDNTLHTFRDIDRERLPSTSAIMQMHQTIPSISAEDLLSSNGNMHSHNMAEQLKSLFCHPCGTDVQSENNLSIESQSSNIAVAGSIDGDGNNSNDDIQSEDIRRSTSNTGYALSENALSAEVQSIVERIQNSSPIDNDDDDDDNDSETRMITESQETNGGNNLQELHLNENVLGTGRRHRNVMIPGELRYSIDSDSVFNATYWRNYMRNRRANRGSCWLYQNLYTYRSFQRSVATQRDTARQNSNSSFHDSLHRHSTLREGDNSDSNYGEHNNYRSLHRDNTSIRQEFNIPTLQVNSVPVSDFNNLPGNSRRRPPTPPHTPPPYLITSFPNNIDSRNNDYTNFLVGQFRSTAWVNNYRNRV